MFMLQKMMLFSTIGSFGLSAREAYTIMLCPSWAIIVGVVLHRCWHRHCHHLCTPPQHMVRHRNFIFGIHMHICPLYVHIEYLMILTCSFKWQPFWYFSLICYPAHVGSHRDFISHVLKYLFFTYTHKRG